MNHLVVDTSVAAKWFLDEDHREAGRRVLARGSGFSAPELMLIELDNVFWKRVRRGELKPADAAAARKLLKKIPIKYYPDSDLRERAFSLSLATDCAVYDCLYLALALRLSGKLVTADRKFFRAVSRGPLQSYVVWIENF